MARSRILMVVAVLASTACAAETATTSSLADDSTTIAEVTTTVGEMTTTAAPTTTFAPGSAPAELAGQWGTDLETGDPQMDRVFITFTGVRYSVSRGPNSATGNILVEGDRITFSGADVCSGVGVYQWSIDGDNLTFTMLDPPDECGLRSPILAGITYTR
jgi:hypothetical protein